MLPAFRRAAALPRRLPGVRFVSTTRAQSTVADGIPNYLREVKTYDNVYLTPSWVTVSGAQDQGSLRYDRPLVSSRVRLRANGARWLVRARAGDATGGRGARWRHHRLAGCVCAAFLGAACAMAVLPAPRAG